MFDADILIIGSGMGGATMAAALAPTGASILIVERGDYLPPSSANRDDEAIFTRGHFRPDEEWIDHKGKPFNPGNYYYVGGNSKFYGAVLMRYREEDFKPLNHLGGVSPSWPIDYQTLEPFYQQAETLYNVCGQLSEDPTEPSHSGNYPNPPIPDEPVIADLRQRLKRLGLHPSSLPLGVDLPRWLENGKTPWDAFPDSNGGKMDAESVGIKAALAHKNVQLLTRTPAIKLLVDQDKAANAPSITGVVVDSPEGKKTLRAKLVIVCAGAVQSAILLQASATEVYPNGLANRSDQLGRNLMNHNTSAVLALHPLRKNPSIYQKTLAVNDFYFSGGEQNYPLGNIQLVGKVSGTILAAKSPLPRFMANWIAERSIDFLAMSEDLPDPKSRVILKNGKIGFHWHYSNLKAHQQLVRKLKSILQQAGFPIMLSHTFDQRTPSHQCGTARMGDDPATSVVDSFGRTHDHPNLFIMDGAILPTSAAVNPSLTIAALALRLADHIKTTEL